MIQGAPIPAWIAVPIAVIMMIVVAAHAQALAKAQGVPESRQRIRLANAGLMLVTIPLLTIGFSLINSATQPRLWVMVWLGAMLLVVIILALAVMDTLNTVRLSRRRREQLRGTLSEYRAHLIERSRRRPDNAGQESADDGP